MQLAYLLHFSSIRIDAQMYYIVLIFTYAYVQSSLLLSLLVLDPANQVLNPNMNVLSVKQSPVLCKNKNNKKNIKTTTLW